MVTTLYLIRHGETEGAETKRYKGSLDVPLSENGVRQVGQAAAFVAGHIKSASRSRHLSYLRDIHTPPKNSAGQTTGNDDRRAPERLEAVYTSDLGRAVTSGGIIAVPHGVVPVQIPALRERNFGIWEGMSFLEIREQYPEEFGAWAANPLKYSPVNGESTIEVKERVIGVLDRLLAEHSGAMIAVVAHGGVNRIILCHILGIPLENIFRIEQDYAAVNVIEFWEGTPVVKLMNRGFHG